LPFFEDHCCSSIRDYWHIDFISKKANQIILRPILQDQYISTIRFKFAFLTRNFQLQDYNANLVRIIARSNFDFKLDSAEIARLKPYVAHWNGVILLIDQPYYLCCTLFLLPEPDHINFNRCKLFFEACCGKNVSPTAFKECLEAGGFNDCLLEVRDFLLQEAFGLTYHILHLHMFERLFQYLECFFAYTGYTSSDLCIAYPENFYAKIAVPLKIRPTLFSKINALVATYGSVRSLSFFNASRLRHILDIFNKHDKGWQPLPSKGNCSCYQPQFYQTAKITMLISKRIGREYAIPRSVWHIVIRYLAHHDLLQYDAMLMKIDQEIPILAGSSYKTDLIRTCFTNQLDFTQKKKTHLARQILCYKYDRSWRITTAAFVEMLRFKLESHYKFPQLLEMCQIRDLLRDDTENSKHSLANTLALYAARTNTQNTLL
ncbi:MAG: hypothetical protein ACMG6E_00195, partial [Candidatus Roizmanbacteria bacterium]